MWRMHIIIKSLNNKNRYVGELIYKKIGFSIFEKKWTGVRIVLDIDPISMM